MRRFFALVLCLVVLLPLIPAAAAEDIVLVDADEIEIVDTEESTTTSAEGFNNSTPIITASPKSVTAYAGTTVKFTVAASNAETYQWFFRLSNSSGWAKSTTEGATTPTLSVSAIARRDGYQYRCRVTNSAGSSYSNVATLTVTNRPAITVPPESLRIVAGEDAKFTVRADGAKSYQWYWRTDEVDSWHKSTVSTANKPTLVYKNLSSSKSGRQYICKVSNDAGYVLTSVVTLTVEKTPIITTQPESLSIKPGATASFAVSAEGATAYQWYWRAGKDDSWHKSTVSTANKPTLIYKNLSSSKSGRQYKCKVFSSEGYTYSAIATLTVAETLVFFTQPTDVLTKVGASVVFTVSTDRATAYQWFWRADETSEWHVCEEPGAATDTLVLSALDSDHDGRQYFCEVSDSGTPISSDIATLSVVGKPHGCVEACEGAIVSYTVPCKAKGLSYQWYYDPKYGSPHPSTFPSARSATLVVEALWHRNGYRYYCIVTSDAGSVRTDSVKLKLFYGPGKWVLDEDGQLTIGANGTTGSWDEEVAFQWSGDDSPVKSIVVRPGTRIIDEYIFFDLPNLVSITIPDSVTTIYSAFNLSNKLTDVYYSGTEEQWNKIKIHGGNDSLLNANIHFNS